MVQEVLNALALQSGAVVVDATVGLGGHAQALLQAIGPSGRLIAIDRDAEALASARQRLEPFARQIIWAQAPFAETARVLRDNGVNQIDAALMDLGVSSLQLDKAERGFSFMREGPLDMRMDASQESSAATLVNHASQLELTEIIREYGEEKFAGRIARAIVDRRPFWTTTQLAETIRKAVPSSGSHGKIDASTRTFQAIRIAVNGELDQLHQGLVQLIQALKPKGRVAVLSYHSLEDRIIKVIFRDQSREGIIECITQKPVRPSEDEVRENPRARSASLRAARRR
jgi:16S rRNA (cytosine1402-N4)-methyltransferase